MVVDFLIYLSEISRYSSLLLLEWQLGRVFFKTAILNRIAIERALVVQPRQVSFAEETDLDVVDALIVIRLLFSRCVAVFVSVSSFIFIPCNFIQLSQIMWSLP